MRMASLPGARGTQVESRTAQRGLQPLSGDLVRFFGDCGVMKAEVDAVMKAAR
jgi:hypothetical protein